MSAVQGKKGVTTTIFFYRRWVSRLNRRRSLERFSSESDSWKTTGRISGFELGFGEAIRAMHLRFLKQFAMAALCIGLACVGYAEDTPASKPTDQPQGSNPTAAPAAASETAPETASAPAPAAAAPAPLPTPAITGPLQAALPMSMEIRRDNV